MSTYGADDYAAQDFKEFTANGAMMVAGRAEEGDVVKYKFHTLVAAVAVYSEAPGAGSQLFVDRSTDGQVTFTDAASSSKDIDFVLIGY